MTDQFMQIGDSHSEIAAAIVKAAQAVHQELGPGFEEVVYQRALALEFTASGLNFSREVWLNIRYKNKTVGRKRIDFIVEPVLVEIRAKSALEAIDVAQGSSFLKALGYPAALLLNFGAKQLETERII